MSSNLTSSATIGFVPNLKWIGTWNWKTYRKKIVYRILFSSSEPVVHDYRCRSGAQTSLRMFESYDYPPFEISRYIVHTYRNALHQLVHKYVNLNSALTK